MREIKFRAFDRKDKLMYVDIQDGIDFDDGSHYSFSQFLNWSGNEDDYHVWEVMQFTGLKDKNGVDIYEGDILSGKEKGDLGVVNYTTPQFTVYPIRDGIINTLGDGRVNIEKLEFSEVIGNIYQNPELLKEIN